MNWRRMRRGKAVIPFIIRFSIGVRVSWKHADLPYFCQWKMLGKGEYVLGMEPLNAPLDGKKIGEEGCLAPVLQPGESKTYSLHFSFIEEL